MSEDVKKITPEELEDIQKVRSEYQEITVKLGQIQVQRMQISNQLELLNKTEEDLGKQSADTTQKERKAINDLQEKYGKVNINLDSGEINDS